MQLQKRLFVRRATMAIALAATMLVPRQVSAFNQEGTDSGVETHISLPALPLAQALRELERQAGIDVSFDAASTLGKQSRRVNKATTGEEALRMMLEGTGLAALKNQHGILELISVERSPVIPPANQSLLVDAELPTVLVTGTHIRDAGPVGSQTIIMDIEDIRRSGVSGTEQLLQSLPQNFRGGDAGASADVSMSLGSQRGFNMTAGSGVNLRGLGANATLVLVNGRRTAPSSGGTFTDISMIPLEAIERVEILADGASAVYGADAVGGVVNIILKSGYETSETRLLYGETSQAGRDESRVTHTLGRRWNSGGIMLTADYFRQSHLLASERDFTSDVPSPTTIFPSNRMVSVSTLMDHSISNWNIQGDLQYSKADRFMTVASGAGRNDSHVEPIRRGLAMTMGYASPDGWDVSLDVSANDEVATSQLTAWRNDGSLDYRYRHVRKQEQRAGELKGSGELFALPAGPMKFAVGLAFKDERYHRTIDLYALNQGSARDSGSLFAELRLPIVGEPNARSGLSALDISVSGRLDHYSDFGSTANPRVGISWSPVDSLSLRSSYSTSYRAPSIGEESRFSEGGIVGVEVASYPTDTTGQTWIPVVTWLGSRDLKPELARNRSIGLDWKPASAKGVSVELTYYDIRYTDRIVLPPLDLDLLYSPEASPFLQRYADPSGLRAAVNDAVSRGIPFYDFTFGEFGSDPLSVADSAYYYLWTNAQRVDMSGLDISIKYPFRHQDHHLEATLDGSYITEIRNRLTSSSPSYDLVGTFGNPPKFKARSSLSWTRLGTSATINVNYADSYTDTTGLRDRAVDSFTTADVVLRHMFKPSASTLLDGLSVSLSVLNAFDKNPPYIEASGRGSHYDPSNASPLGRMTSIQLVKRW
jgi:iron complex outermembrane recepter protein